MPISKSDLEHGTLEREDVDPDALEGFDFVEEQKEQLDPKKPDAMPGSPKPKNNPS